MKQALKSLLFRLLGKDPEAVVVTFATGPAELCRRMYDEVRSLVPDRRHFLATPENWPELRRQLRRCRIGLAPVLLTREPDRLRRAAFRLAPRKILAYNTRLERHHLRPDLASFLFWRGVPLDRIWLRPRWWPFPVRERSTASDSVHRYEGRPCSPVRRRIAVLSPYFPYPLSHGGAVRIYNLLRELASEFDIELFAFVDNVGQALSPANLDPVLELCARVVLVDQPRYREPRWCSLLPPEVHEFRSPAMRRALAEERKAFGYERLQVEYTQLAEYGEDILTEHDVTFDLFAQVFRARRTLSAWWDWFRWRRFETRAVRRFGRIVVMSGKDAEMLGPAIRTAVVENGVDLDRFQPEAERPGRRLLFIGSFRHFPNVEAYRFFTERIWPLLRDKFPDLELTVVAGADHLTCWRAFTDTPEPASDPRIRLLGFVSDVRPLYVEANLVVVPTTVSAGTNVKVLEAMAMRRAVISTSSGCAGLGLLDRHSVWIADSHESFAAAVATLINDPDLRSSIAESARGHAERHFSWSALGEKQRALFRP
jgi:glycosyltransferase involved in cell wall biosynthesis